MLRFKVPESSSLIGHALKNLPQQLQLDVLVCAAERKEEVVIPDGDFSIQAGDILSIIAIPGNASVFFHRIGIHTNQVKNALIIGGGEITYYLTVILLSMGIQVKIIEKNLRIWTMKMLFIL